MKVTHRFKIPYDKHIYSCLRNAQREAARVWNDILDESVLYMQTMKRWLSKTEIESHRKKYYALHSQTVQAIADKYVQSCEGTREKRKKGDKKAKYPWRRKAYFCVPFKQNGFEVDGNDIVLKFKRDKTILSSLAAATIKKAVKLLEKDLVREDVHLRIPNLSDEDLTSCTYAEIVWDNGYYFHYVVEVPEKKESYDVMEMKPSGGDIGEIHSIAVSTEDKALVISGRAIRSIKQWRAKAYAELSKLMSRCKHGSRQWKKYSRAKKRLRVRSAHQLDDLFHKTTRAVVDFLVQENVTHFVIGNLDGIEKNTVKNKVKKNKTTRSRRQQLSTLEHGRITKLLSYKAKLHCITVNLVNEAWTSKDCPFCGERHEPKGRNFYCPVHKTGIPRDVNGGQNIARKLYPMPVKPVAVKYKQPVWLKRHLTTFERNLAKHENDRFKYRRIATA